jgi:hypothetical protein
MRGLKQMYVEGAHNTVDYAAAVERRISAENVPDFAGLEVRRVAVMKRNREGVARG